MSHRSRIVFWALALTLTASLIPPGTVSRADNSDSLEKMVLATRGDIKAKRDSAMGVLITLEGDQKKAFWPLQQAYDVELRKILDEQLALGKEFEKIYNKLDDAKARSIADRYFKTEEARLALHRTYFTKIADEVSPVAAVQFIQLQRQFETMYDMQAAASAPLATK